VKAEYIVAKPVIDVKAAAVQALFENCGNELNIQVPSLGANYKPSFTCNAPLTNGPTRGQVVVVPPNRNEVTIGVSSGGTFIDKVTFRVRPVPLPQIVPKSIGGVINPKVGIKSNSPYINLTIEPDRGFADFLPKEANYNIAECAISIGKGRSARISSTVQGSNIRLGGYNLQNGERVVLEIKKLTRTNSRGQLIDVPLSATAAQVTVPIVD
jgi:hypothetical protein